MLSQYFQRLEKGITSWAALNKEKPTAEEIQRLARKIVDEHATTEAGKDAKEKGDDVLAHARYYLRDVLTFLEFESAVTHGDPGRVLKVLKMWALAFRGAGMTRYAREALEILVTWETELPEPLQRNLEKAWFVNRWGRPRRFIAADLYIEHLNRLVKVCLVQLPYHLMLLSTFQHIYVAQKSGLTVENIREKGSSCVEALEEASRKVSEFFGRSEKHRRHKESKFYHDLRVLVEHLLKYNLHTLDKRRKVQGIVTRKGAWKKGAIVDILLSGGGDLLDGVWDNFVRTSTYDPALGYPMESEEKEDEDVIPPSDTVFDNVENPLSWGDDQSLSDTMVESQSTGLGGIGGADEFYRGYADDED